MSKNIFINMKKDKEKAKFEAKGLKKNTLLYLLNRTKRIMRKQITAEKILPIILKYKKK